MRRTALILSLLACAACIRAGDVLASRSDAGTSGAVFLKLNAGSRPAAMGEAFTGVSDDVNAVFYNPGATGMLKLPEFTAQYGAWFQGIGYNALGFVYPAGKTGTFGLGIVNLSVSGIEKRSSDTLEADSEFGASDFAYVVHYGRAVSEKLSGGVNLKFVTQRIDEETASAFAGDLGLLWISPVRGLRAGLVAQNIGGGVAFVREEDPLPFLLRTGMGYQRALGERSNISIAADAVLPRDNDLLLSAGTELRYRINPSLAAAVRAGYKMVSREQLGGLAGLTGGAGLMWNQFGFDFAWVPYGELGDTFRYSLVVKFP